LNHSIAAKGVTMSIATPPKPVLPNRAFGLVLAAALFAYGAASWWWHHGVLGWPMGLGLLTLAIAFWRPAWLSPATRLWMGIGELLHRIVSPITLGLLYFGIITPLALALRLGRRDMLKLRFEPDSDSYWIGRDPPGPDIAGLSRQF